MKTWKVSVSIGRWVKGVWTAKPGQHKLDSSVEVEARTGNAACEKARKIVRENLHLPAGTHMTFIPIPK